MGGRGGKSKKKGSGGGGGGGLTDEEQRYIDINGSASAIVLNGEQLHVPQWIQEREGLYGGLRVTRETEKAVLVEASDIAQTGRRTSAWVPKSTLLTTKEYAQKGVAKNSRAAQNQRYTKYLKDTAAANGVKIGNTSSWDKISAKLKAKGVKVKSRDQFN